VKLKHKNKNMFRYAEKYFISYQKITNLMFQIFLTVIGRLKTES